MNIIHEAFKDQHKDKFTTIFKKVNACPLCGENKDVFQNQPCEGVGVLNQCFTCWHEWNTPNPPIEEV